MLGGNKGAVLAGAGMCVVLALGAYIGFGQQTATPEENAEQETSVQAGAEAPLKATEARVTAPRFDELRRETDGTTIIAGRAEPMSDVKILVDGAEVATAKTDSAGVFAAITSLPPNQAAQVITLSARKDEVVTASVDEIILAPSAGADLISAQSAKDLAQPAVAAVDGTAQAESAVKDAYATQPEVSVVESGASDAAADPSRLAVLKSDAEGVTLLNPDLPAAMKSVALDTIGYSELGEVQLTGRAQADAASVRIYLDNRAVISLPVEANGRWRGDLPDVDEGVYTLRVDELTATGDISSRVETPFKRESAAILAQAAATADGPVKSVTVQAGATLWAIARDRYGDGTLYVQVFEANSASIRNPDLIYPGQVFDLPN
ncbi:LysM domain protein [Sulfitobacter guttiformis KCTC 32187]|nr:LysM domain protein [Sulfitobacter guttiformis KCTC 32187]